MKLAVLGATGRTGRAVVRQALERGHEVQALVRDAGKVAVLPRDDRLTVIGGDLMDEADVAKVVAGVDAVINVAGPVKGSPTNLQQRAAASVLAAMRDHGVARLLMLTGAGVRVAGDEPKLIDRVFTFALRTLQPALLADSEAAVAAVRASDLRWTIARAPRLTDDPPTGRCTTARHVGASTGTKVSRGDVASFLLDAVEQDSFEGALPVVSN
jgi:putative NADH-flavin reductase